MGYWGLSGPLYKWSLYARHFYNLSTMLQRNFTAAESQTFRMCNFWQFGVGAATICRGLVLNCDGQSKCQLNSVGGMHATVGNSSRINLAKLQRSQALCGYLRWLPQCQTAWPVEQKPAEEVCMQQLFHPVQLHICKEMVMVGHSENLSPPVFFNGMSTWKDLFALLYWHILTVLGLLVL